MRMPRGTLRREVLISDVRYTPMIDAEGFKLIKTSHRRDESLHWTDLVSGDAALSSSHYGKRPSPCGGAPCPSRFAGPEQ